MEDGNEKQTLWSRIYLHKEKKGSCLGVHLVRVQQFLQRFLQRPSNCAETLQEATGVQHGSATTTSALIQSSLWIHTRLIPKGAC